MIEETLDASCPAESDLKAGDAETSNTSYSQQVLVILCALSHNIVLVLTFLLKTLFTRDPDAAPAPAAHVQHSPGTRERQVQHVELQVTSDQCCDMLEAS